MKYRLGRTGFVVAVASMGFRRSRSRRIDGKQVRTIEGLSLARHVGRGKCLPPQQLAGSEATRPISSADDGDIPEVRGARDA